jgi:lysophospholipase L1-like esterase
VRSLFADAVDGPAQTALVAQFVADAPTVLWLAIGTNDYGLSAWTDTAFGTAYAAVLDAFHAAMPNVPVYCQTPLSRTTETANGHGDTLPQYRAQITTACLARPWTKLVDGTAILAAADLQDGLHPHEAGHAKYAARVRAILFPPRSGGRGSFCGMERSGGTFTGRIGK